MPLEPFAVKGSVGCACIYLLAEYGKKRIGICGHAASYRQSSSESASPTSDAAGLLYHDPQRPGQKGSCEKNRVELRRVLPRDPASSPSRPST